MGALIENDVVRHAELTDEERRDCYALPHYGF